MKKGDIVVAIAGKEKNQIFVVVDAQENFVYLADGKRRKKDSPKKKSIKHIQKASSESFPAEQLNVQDEKVNAAIRKTLKKLKGD